MHLGISDVNKVYTIYLSRLWITYTFGLISFELNFCILCYKNKNKTKL